MPLAEVDLGSWKFWNLDDELRDGAFATLRREAPISFHPALESPATDDHVGHWALTRHDDVWYASRHPHLFSSSPSIVINDANPELSEYFGSMIVMDDPRHLRLRNIVSRAFTPKVVARAESSVRERARRNIEEMIAKHPDGKGEVVTELAGLLPLQVICDMMGIPEDDHQRIFHWTNVILGFGDPDIAADYEEFVKVALDIGGYASALAEDRRVNPSEDLTTALVQAEVDGEQLTSAEIASFFILLVVAGNETTRNAISHGVLALTRYPDERAKWWANYEEMAPTAVEEIVRWASPVIYMRRRVTEDIELNGTKMAAGDKATLWYVSANRDEEKFVNPWTFDLGRTRIRTWDSAAVGRTSASAPTWPVARSASPSRNCAVRYPTSRRPKNRRGCCRHSFTASSGYPCPGHHRAELVARRPVRNGRPPAPGEQCTGAGLGGREGRGQRVHRRVGADDFRQRRVGRGRGNDEV